MSSIFVATANRGLLLGIDMMAGLTFTSKVDWTRDGSEAGVCKMGRGLMRKVLMVDLVLRL